MDPRRNTQCLQHYSNLLPTLGDYITRYSRERPDDIALIEIDTDEEVTWRDFEIRTNAFAAKLLNIGLKKGDILATSLPMLKEHVFLEFACFKLGIIIAPLDLRLKADEIIQSFNKIKPKAYFFLGNTPVMDFRPIIREVMKQAQEYCDTWVQFQKDQDGIIEGAIWINHFARNIKQLYLLSLLNGNVNRARKKVCKRDACLIIFTTGSTGFPKAALLCHENILVQTIGISVGIGMLPEDRMLVNLPPSHVGCQTEQFMATVYSGATSCLLHIFDPRKTLDAIKKYNITCFGQIPAMLAMEWRLPDYNTYDFSSLRFAMYGGQTVDRPFLEKLATMNPNIVTGLGLTETAGLCTYTKYENTIDEIFESIGFDTPLCPISIRKPMNPNGSAGSPVPAGEIGEICFEGPQIFLGYLGDPENTVKTISSEGVCYTGDIGSYDEKGLHYAGRSKLMIKPKGYQVFPAEVENFITDCLKDKVAATACVGVKHDMFSEAIMAFVEVKEGKEVTLDEIESRLKNIASYKRPHHIEFLKVGTMPLNRVAKTDYMLLKKMADSTVEKLRAEGRWD